MNDTVAHKNVRQDDLGIVGIDTTSVDADRDVLATQGWHLGVVHETGAVVESAHNMVFQDGGKIFCGQVRKVTSDSLESIVVGNEAGEVRSVIHCVHKREVGKSTCSRGEVKGDCAGRNVLWEGKESIDDVDDTTSEVGAVNNGRILEQAREEGGVASSQGLDTLSTSDIRVHTRLQGSGNEGHVGEVIVSSTQNMVPGARLVSKRLETQATYWSIAWTRAGSVVRAAAELELRNSLKAALFGASRVMFVRLAN